MTPSLEAEIIPIPVEYEVRLIGCMHLANYPAGILIPAYEYDQLLLCPFCLTRRQWRLSHEEPGTTRGRPRFARC